MLKNQPSPRLRVSNVSAPASLSQSARRRLTHLLFFKSILEILFVSALAAGFHFIAFNPSLRGSLDRADAREVAGWALDEAQPSARVEVQLYLDGSFAASRTADRPRPDVLEAGRAADARHGFVFDTPALAAGEHEARVYAVHASNDEARRTLTLIGSPLRFHVAARETLDASGTNEPTEGASRR
ncbi:MAG TPA: hypothetical protein VNA19_08540 [Pyrinomonadaceae bacterium]|nr:hypothetical protein [Pyrinomonadaceae bacterium]